MRYEMGGAVGHLQHLHDNRDLTFKEIFNILEAAADGKLESVSEKLDGLNLTFSWDVDSDSLRVALNNGNIKNGGLDATSLASKFEGRGNLSDAFNSAFSILKKSLSSLHEEKKLSLFGSQTNLWYSMEIIYAESSNVINYDSNNIVLHGWPIIRSNNGVLEMAADNEDNVDELVRHVEGMQKAVESRGWKVRGPALLRIKRLSDSTTLNDAKSRIINELSEINLDKSATIRDYIEVKTRFDVEAFGLSKKTTDMIVDRCMGEYGSPTLVDIKKISNKSDHVTISEFIKSFSKRMKGYVRPVELAINDFAIELLRGLESTLVVETSREVKRLREEVTKAISTIENSGNEEAMTILREQMEKLKSVNSITSPVEGVVFIYKSNAYKFTGSFSATNQILGLFKYGRGSVKLI